MMMPYTNGQMQPAWGVINYLYVAATTSEFWLSDENQPEKNFAKSATVS
jgi:hypothetical protein